MAGLGISGPPTIASWSTYYPLTLSKPQLMTYFETGLYIRTAKLDGCSKPFPLTSGSLTDDAYRALSLYNPLKTSDANFVLSNDLDEILSSRNRCTRGNALLPDEMAFTLPIRLAGRQQITLV